VPKSGSRVLADGAKAFINLQKKTMKQPSSQTRREEAKEQSKEAVKKN
jgi:hypothetical protein